VVGKRACHQRDDNLSGGAVAEGDTCAVHNAQKWAGPADFGNDGRLAETELTQSLAEIRIAREGVHTSRVARRELAEGKRHGRKIGAGR
jgi:hypothetical protein